MLPGRLTRDYMHSGGLSGPPVIRTNTRLYTLGAIATSENFGIPPTTAPGTVAAEGWVFFAGNPNAAEFITLNGKDWTFVAGAPAGNQTQRQGSLAATLTQLVSDLNGSADTDIDDGQYGELSGSLLYVRHKILGYEGHRYTLADDGVIAATLSGTHLTGGAGNGPRFVMLHHLHAAPIPLFAQPNCHDLPTYAQMAPIQAAQYPLKAAILHVEGCSHIAVACSVAAPFNITALENRSIHMIGPPVIRADAVDQAIGGGAGAMVDLTIPNNAAGKLPKYVLLGCLASDVILCKPAITGDTTAYADLPVVIGLYDGPVILDVAGCDFLRMASVGAADVRLVALENSGSASI